MSGAIRYRTAELPDIECWVFDGSGNLINFSTGYSFELKLGRPGSAAAFTKTTGFTGAAGSGTETSGVPNLVISFTAGELDSLVNGRTTGQLKFTNGGRDRVLQFPWSTLDVVT